MSLKLLEAVYSLDKKATTATEQAVLAALAYRANDKTRLCFPKQETIAAMTHLHRSTVVSCLNSLRERGFIEWKSGGLTKNEGNTVSRWQMTILSKFQSTRKNVRISQQAGVCGDRPCLRW